MSIFATDPISINDAVPAARSFAYQYQEPGTQVAGRYNEPAAANSAESIIRIAHSNMKDGNKRHLLSRSEVCALSATDAAGNTTGKITVNVTVTHAPLAVEADVTNQVTIATNAILASGALSKILDGSI
jgi:hypothetical protein